MPTYEYRCPECSADFEKFQKMSDEPVADCPSCGAAAERRLSGGAGFIFKGSGFYITDYRSEGYKKAAGSDTGTGKGEGTTEASGGTAASSSGADKGGSSASAGASGSSTSTPKAD